MFNTFIGEHTDELIEHLMHLINIPTVMDTAQPNAPFGNGVAQGLEYVLTLARSFGMQVKNYDGYAGEITIGTGENIIGILCHVDVVDGGEGWDTPAFTAQLKDEKIYGRGSLDDKGPLISCLYVMKYLQDYRLIPENAALRMIIGTNEEENWEGIQYYVKKAPVLPKASIVPDGNFPAICYEKGLLDFNLVSKHLVDATCPIQLLTLEGGSSRNVVAGKCRCTLSLSSDTYINEKIKERLSTLDYTSVDYKDPILTIETHGKSVHCMTPEKGRSAISLMLNALHKLGTLCSHHLFIADFMHFIGMEYNGQSYNCAFEDTLSGKLTFNVGKISLEGDKPLLEANLRYPVSTKYEIISDAVAQTSVTAGFEYIQKDQLPAICMDESMPLVQMLLDAYQTITKDTKSKPLSIGGATYARAIPNAVAFGPLLPYEEELAHEPNEFLLLDSLFKMTEIYEHALRKLLNSADKL